MTKSRKYLILSIIILIILISCYYYIFNIFETTIQVNPQNLFADNQSTITIEVIPINALAWKVPFRNVTVDFKITEGQDLIKIIYENRDKGIIKLKAENITGKVMVYVKPKYSLLPSIIEINIYPNLAMINKSNENLLR